MKETDIVVTEVTEPGNVTHKLMIAMMDYPVNLPLVQTPVIVGYACFCPKSKTPFLAMESLIVNSVEIKPIQRIFEYKGKPELDLKLVITDFLVAAEMMRAKFPKT